MENWRDIVREENERRREEEARRLEAKARIEQERLDNERRRVTERLERLKVAAEDENKRLGLLAKLEWIRDEEGVGGDLTSFEREEVRETWRSTPGGLNRASSTQRYTYKLWQVGWRLASEKHSVRLTYSETSERKIHVSLALDSKHALGWEVGRLNEREVIFTLGSYLDQISPQH